MTEVLYVSTTAHHPFGSSPATGAGTVSGSVNRRHRRFLGIPARISLPVQKTCNSQADEGAEMLKNSGVRWSLPLVLAGLLLGPLQAQDKKGFDTVDPAKVDKAIRAGVEYLKITPSPASHHEIAHTDELVLLTLVEARVPDEDPLIQKLLIAPAHAGPGWPP